MATKETSIDQEKEARVKFTPKWYHVICIGGLIRIAMKSLFHDALMNRVELVSPLSSWYRMQECITLSEHNILPYSGDICHHHPLMIYFFKTINNYSNNYYNAHYLFIFADLLISIVLYSTSLVVLSSQLKDESEEKSTYANDVEVMLLGDKNRDHIPIMVMSFYLFNPFSILTCQAQSTEVFSNLAMSLVLLAMVNKCYVMACLFIAVSAHLSFYPIMLTVPVLQHVYRHSANKSYDTIRYILITAMFITGLMFLSYYIYDSWSYLYAVYGFILQAPDLTPNMGLFWYFFAEMFDHFRLFFLWVYQMNVFIYLIPVSVILRRYPMMTSYVLLSLMSLFKSYSNLGSLVVPLSLLPLYSHIFRYMRNILLVNAFLFITPILVPGMWYLWIYAGSGNANFFYAVTLAYGTGQVFLLSDAMYAFLRYKFHLRRGVALKSKDGKEVLPVLR